MSMLCDPKSTFKYTPGGNCQAIWKKYGWVAPSEYRDDYMFKTNRESGENHEEVTSPCITKRK